MLGGKRKGGVLSTIIIGLIEFLGTQQLPLAAFVVSKIKRRQHKTEQPTVKVLLMTCTLFLF